LHSYEQSIYQYALDQLSQFDFITIYGDKNNNTGIISFNIEHEHHSDIGTLLDQQNIAVRTGHHCAMPLMAYLGVDGTIRASFTFYNTRTDVDHLVQGIKQVYDLLI